MRILFSRGIVLLLVGTVNAQTLTLEEYRAKVLDYNQDIKQSREAVKAAKELRASILMAVIPALASAFLLYTDRQWPAVAAMGAALICLNQHRIGHRLMKKNLIADVKSAFPKWLMDLALLIQSENVQVAIQKSREHIPVILKEEVNTLVERLDVEPESSDPYHRFLDCLNLPEINAAMGMLYAVSGSVQLHTRRSAKNF